MCIDVRCRNIEEAAVDDDGRRIALEGLSNAERDGVEADIDGIALLTANEFYGATTSLDLFVGPKLTSQVSQNFN